ncbi:MAG: PilZ domain-containing protein [Actinomycetota bacterium]
MGKRRHLVSPGATIVFIATGTTVGRRGTIIEVGELGVRAKLETDESPALTQPTEGGLVVVAPDERSVLVAGHARPVGSLAELTPHPGEPPDRRADPRVPAHSHVSVHVLGRLGATLTGSLRDLSLGGCRFERPRDGGPVPSRGSNVDIETMLDGDWIRVGGEVVGLTTIGSVDAFDVRFTSVDAGSWSVIERFVERRLERIRATNSVSGPITAHVELGCERISSRFEPLDDSFDVPLPVSSRFTARFRLPGVAPTLTAIGSVTGHDDDRSLVEWSRTDPVTRVLLERAAMSRRQLAAVTAP